MIEFQNVTLQYHYEQYSLFEGLSFTLLDGLNTVLCDVQSGKTSLCKLILGEEKPNCGKIIVDGKDITKKDAEPISALYLPSQPTFFEGKSVLFNLQYPLRVRKKLAKNDVRVTEAAKKLGLEDLLATKVRKLTFEQKKLLALARGLTVPRETVLFDGFFDNTIERSQLDLQRVLSLFPCKMAVVFTTNAKMSCGNTVVLDGKECVFQGDSKGAQEVVAGLEWLADKI